MSFQPNGIPTWTDDPSKDIMINLDSVAYTDLNKERNTRFISNEGKQAAKVLQCGLQYYMFTQQQMQKKIAQLQEYNDRQVEEL